MRISIFGAGAVGAYFGGRLAEADEQVAFIARGENLRALRERGLRVASPEGDFTLQSVRAAADPAELGPADAILLAVKTWQVSDAARAIAPALGPDTFVVPLQNGVEAPAQLAAVLGPGRVLGGLCRIIAWVESPGVVRHEGAEPYIGFGELAGGLSARAERLQQAFSRCRGVTAEALEDVRAEMWRKFLFISSVSGLGAVTRAPIGLLRSRPETRELLDRAMREVLAVARAHAVALPDDVVEETLAFTDSLPEEGTTSMQRDIMAGRPSELEAQNGAVVRLGMEKGVATPVHDFVYRSLRPLEARARGEVAF
ncbi:MAG TPA: 2-dehydropantoate 2-reductase [Gemmatimonadales bacterium]|nr:2-dehydropantoate 2-reductase [Gemmatimonadales bacterium]